MLNWTFEAEFPHTKLPEMFVRLNEEPSAIRNKITTVLQFDDHDLEENESFLRACYDLVIKSDQSGKGILRRHDSQNDALEKWTLNRLRAGNLNFAQLDATSDDMEIYIDWECESMKLAE